MNVYVVERDKYAPYILGVFSTLSLACAAFPGDWLELRTGFWQNGGDADESTWISEWVLDEAKL